jgi:hypothetical protein
MEDKSQLIQIGPCQVHHVLRNLPACTYKQRTPSSTKRSQVSRLASLEQTYLAGTHIHKTEAIGNDAYQNALTTLTEVRILHKQPNSHIQSNTQTTCTYGIQLWDAASTSNIEILERFQSRILRIIVHAPW